MKPAAFAACLAALCSLPQARAQEAAMPPDSLLSVWRDALFADPSWRAARAQAAAGQEAPVQALARLLPNVAVSASRGKNSTRQESRPAFGGKTANDYRYDSANYAVTLRQPLYRPQEYAAYGQSLAQAGAAGAELLQAGQELALRVGQAYFGALLAQAELRANAAQQAAYAEQGRQAEKAFLAGYGTRTEIDEAAARLALAKAEGLELGYRFSRSLDALGALAGRPVLGVSRIDPARLPLVGPSPAAFGPWLLRIEAGSPRLAALEAQVQAAQKEVEKAQAGHKPTLDLVAQRSRSESGGDTSIGTKYDTGMVGLQLSIPVFSGGYVSSSVRQAAALLDRQNALLEAGRRQIRQEAQEAFDGVAQGAKWVAAYGQAEKAAESMAHSTKKGFEAGRRTRQDILDAEGLLAASRRDLARGRQQYLLFRLRLLALAGELDGQAMALFDSWLAPGGSPAGEGLVPPEGAASR